MSFSILLSLDQSRTNRDGSNRLMFRFRHLDKTIVIPSGHSLHPDYWDEKTRRIKSQYLGKDLTLQLNVGLERKRAAMVNQITPLLDQNELTDLSIEQIKKVMKRIADMSDQMADLLTTNGELPYISIK